MVMQVTTRYLHGGDKSYWKLYRCVKSLVAYICYFFLNPSHDPCSFWWYRTFKGAQIYLSPSVGVSQVVIMLCSLFYLHNINHDSRNKSIRYFSHYYYHLKHVPIHLWKGMAERLVLHMWYACNTFSYTRPSIIERNLQRLYEIVV